MKIALIFFIFVLFGCADKKQSLMLSCRGTKEVRDSICSLNDSCKKSEETLFYQLTKSNYELRSDKPDEQKNQTGWLLEENQKEQLHSDTKISTPNQQLETALEVDDDKIHYTDSSTLSNAKGEPFYSSFKEISINRVTGEIFKSERTGMAFNPERMNFTEKCEKVSAKKI